MAIMVLEFHIKVSNSNAVLYYLMYENVTVNKHQIYRQSEKASFLCMYLVPSKGQTISE